MEYSSVKGEAMRAQKYEVVRILDRVRSVVQKNSAFPALEGVLVKDGYFIGSNMELTIQVKSEACRGDSFILPAKAFDLIKNLPDGEVEIREDGERQVLIKTDKIVNRYQTFPADDFAFYQADQGFDNEITLPGERLMEALGHVVYASDEKAGKAILGGVYFEAEPGALNLVAADGHMSAWDQIETSGESDMKVIVPKSAVKKLISLGIIDDVSVAYNKSSVIFRSGDCTVSSRLIDGNFLDYRRFFQEVPESVVLNRKGLLEAMNRAKLCIVDRDNTKHAAVFDFNGGELQVSIADSLSDYSEVIELDSILTEEMRIGFNPNIILETTRVFSRDEIRLSYSSPKAPMYLTEEGSRLRALILPVALSA